VHFQFRAVRLPRLSDIIFLYFLPDSFNPNLYPVRVFVKASLVRCRPWRSRFRRERAREETRYPIGGGSGVHIRRVLVPDSNHPITEMSRHVRDLADNARDPDYCQCAGIRQLLHQPHPLCLSFRELSEGISEDHLLCPP